MTLTPTDRQSLFLRKLLRFREADLHLKCDCGRVATRFLSATGRGRTCERCYAIEQRMEDFHHHNRDNYENKLEV